ncbi:hypothetical protein [Nocardia fluminea]|uniref:DUF8176 domain-containing protein n=1 Tax=Nocardia fluminea TaxID=134984 RepID=A0A2N3V5C3_9NOCA|nr:hypothetical protein [Nocardia fluminea]PKV76776.1 hypothetical protein ATK86_7179 [Nocardia fluminea]
MTRYPHNPSDDDDAQVWVDLPQTPPEHHVVAGNGTGPALDEPYHSSSREEVWIAPLRDSDAPDTADTGGFSRWWPGIRYRMPGPAWAALAATIAILAGLLAVSTDDTGDTGQQVPATAAPPSPTTLQGPCAGLAGAVVTDRAGDPKTLEGVIASFEAAYYIDRDAAKAMAVLAPETGITVEGLAAGIASIPPGTRHCVAITPIAPGTATVHIAEVHPDRKRVDYLQLINTRPADTNGALLISNFQKQG